MHVPADDSCRCSVPVFAMQVAHATCNMRRAICNHMFKYVKKGVKSLQTASWIRRVWTSLDSSSESLWLNQ